MRKRNVFCLTAAVAILLLGLPVVRLDQEAVAQDPKPGRFSALDVIFVVDQSGSMFLYSDPTAAPCLGLDGRIIYENGRPKICGPDCPTECDPDYPKPMRQTAAQYLIDYLSVEPPGEPRVGVAYFGTEANIVIPLFSVTDRGKREEAIRFLEELPDDPQTSPYWWWTNTNKAFDTVYQELFGSPRTLPDREPVIIFLSDGHPDMDWSQADKESFYEQHKQWVEVFKEKGIPFFTILIALTQEYISEQDEYLQQDPVLKSYENIWRHMAGETNGGYYRVHEEYKPEERRRELLDIYHAILAKLRGVSPITTIEGSITAGERRTIQIPRSDCRSLIVEVHKASPQTRVMLLGPGGQSPEPEATREEYVLYSVEYPEEGDWELVLEGGEGSYYIRLDCAQTELFCDLLAPPGQYPQCKAMRIAARLESEAQGPLDDGWVDVLVTLPDGSSENLPLNHKGAGTYEAFFSRTQQRGEYSLEVTGRDREGKKQPAKFEQVVSVLPLLYLDFVQPVPGDQVPSGDLSVQAALKMECEFVSEDPLLSGRDTVINAQLTAASGWQVGPVRLSDSGQGADPTEVDGIFSGVLEGIAPGDYTLIIDLTNEKLSAHDSISGPVHVGLPPSKGTPSPTPRPTLTPTPGPTPTPVRPAISLDKADLGRVHAGGDPVQAKLQLNCAELREEQAISVMLVGVPFELEQTEIYAQPGRSDYRTEVAMRVPKELDPRRQGDERRAYEGKLRFTYPDGTSSDLSFTVEVLPPPIPSWVFLIVGLGLVTVVGAGIGAYRWQAGKGRLTGRIVYIDTPTRFGDALEEELYGERRVLILDEEAQATAAPTGVVFDYDFDKVATEGAVFVEEPPPEAPRGLHTELLFTARRGRTEALLSVAKTNGQVLLNEVPIDTHTPPQRLYDGNTIRVGRYTLKYESLFMPEEDALYSEGPWRGEQVGTGHSFDEWLFEDHGAYGEQDWGDFGAGTPYEGKGSNEVNDDE